MVTRNITRPLSNLAHAAEAAGRSIRHPPVPEEEVREIREATRAFNACVCLESDDAEDRCSRIYRLRCVRVTAARGFVLSVPVSYRAGGFAPIRVCS